MDETTRLALANHAILHGVSFDEAWPLVDEAATAHPEASVRELADAVRVLAVRRTWAQQLPGRQASL